MRQLIITIGKIKIGIIYILCMLGIILMELLYRKTNLQVFEISRNIFAIGILIIFGLFLIYHILRVIYNSLSENKIK